MQQKPKEFAYKQNQKRLYEQAVFKHRIEFAFGLICLAWAGHLIETEEVLPFNAWVNRFFLLLLFVVLIGNYLNENYKAGSAIEKFDLLNQLKEQTLFGDFEKVRDIVSEVGLEGVNSVTLDTLRNSLHFAVANNQLKVTCYLRDIGADINAQDILGNTPVHYAVMFALSQKSYAILLELLRYEETPTIKVMRSLVASKAFRTDTPPKAPQLGFFAKYKLSADSPKINFDIDPTLKNKKGVTILELLESCEDKSTKEYKQAYDSMVLLNQVRHQYKP